MHVWSDVPDQDPRIPAGRGNPILCTEQAPVDTSSEFSMSLHGCERTRRTHGKISSAISPDLDGHVVGTTHQHVGGVGGPGELADSVVVTSEHVGGLAGHAGVEGADNLVNSTGSNDSVAVLVPIVGESLRRHSTVIVVCTEVGTGNRGRTVDGDQLDQVVGGRSWSAKVKDADMAVR